MTDRGRTDPEGPARIGAGRAIGWSALLAFLVFAGSLANGFAYDDEPIIENNRVVTEARWGEAAFGPYWELEEGYGLLYRPVALLAYATQWEAGGGSPAVFHLVNLLLHTAVTALLAWLFVRLARMRPTTPLLERHGGFAALAAGGLFALHPVHVEAVANVVGQAELWAALGVLGAVHLYVWSPGRIWQRSVRLVGIGGCYALGLGAKEIAVTLPALLILVDAVGRGWVAGTARVRRESLVFALLLVTLVAYLALRWLALGSLVGEEVAPIFRGVGTGTRIATALAVFPTTLLLLLLPLDLSSDYDPDVLALASPTDPTTVLGAALLLALVAVVVGFWRRSPMIGFGAAWLLVTWSVVSNLLLTTGVLLAERTLYLPSLGVAMVLGVAVAALAERRGARVATMVLLLLGGTYLVRSATRVPTWYSSFTVAETLAREHPESWRADRTRAVGLVRVGDPETALDFFESAVRKAPHRYALLTEYAAALRQSGRPDAAEPLLERAVELNPLRRDAWILLAEVHLSAGRMREALRVAMEGLRASGQDARFWRIASEAYIGGGFLPAAIRARRVAIALDPDDASNRDRLRELLEFIGRGSEIDG